MLLLGQETCLHIVQTYTYLFAQNPRQTCKDDERHTRAAAIKHSVHRVLSSAQTNTHTHTDYTLQTYMQVGTGRKTTLANDVHQIASKVSARVLTTHLSSRTSLFPLSIFNYIFIFVVAEWHIQPQFATDPKPERTKIEHPPYPTINSPLPTPPSILPWGLCKYVFCDVTSLSLSGE